MYIRCTTIKASKTGEPYKSLRLVESERINGKVKQRTLINLGRYFDVPQAQWQSLSSRIDRLLTGQSSFLSIELDEDLEAIAQRYTAQIIASNRCSGFMLWLSVFMNLSISVSISKL